MSFDIRDATLSEPTSEAQANDESLARVFSLYVPTLHRKFTFTVPTVADKSRWLVHFDECLAQLLESKRSRYPLDEKSTIDSPSVERAALREGQLFLRTDLGDWVPRQCALYRDKLVYQRIKDGVPEGVKSEINILASSSKIASVSDRPNTFQILSPTELQYWAALSGEDMLAWITQIRECINGAIKRQQQLQRRSMVRQWPEELDDLISRFPENQQCADCNSTELANASLSLGVLLCNECSGIHRVVGLGGASIKSLRMRWKPEQFQEMLQKGNAVMNPKYNANIPEFMERITKESPYPMKVQFIETKYGVQSKRNEAAAAAAAAAAANTASSSLSPGDAAARTSGPVMCQRGRKEGWVMRWLALEGGNVNLYKSEKSATPRMSFSLVTCGAKVSGKNENGLDIVTPTRIYPLRVNSELERDGWIEAINLARDQLPPETTASSQSSGSSASRRASKLFRSWKPKSKRL